MGLQNGAAKGNFHAILEPKIAALKPTIQVIQVSLVARGLVSARWHSRSRPGWCGEAVGGRGVAAEQGEAHRPDF